MRRSELDVSKTSRLPPCPRSNPPYSENPAAQTADHQVGPVWAPIPSAPGYEASSLGQVRRSGNDRALAPRVHPRGYRIVDVSVDGKGTSKTVHRLVAEAFHGPALGRQVNHKNADKADNRPANLEWVSAQQNTDHAIAMRLRRQAVSQ
jgi:hypothetical protein